MIKICIDSLSFGKYGKNLVQYNSRTVFSCFAGVGYLIIVFSILGCEPHPNNKIDHKKTIEDIIEVLAQQSFHKCDAFGVG